MIKLSVGCGDKDFGPGWEHIDASHYPHVKSYDITRLPYEDNTVDVIYASHVLEYFNLDEAVAVLKEWRRVLKSGGQLHLSVPDFKTMAELYLKEAVPLARLVGPLYGKMTSGNETVYHKQVYDWARLSDLLQICGFNRIEPWQTNAVDFKEIFDNFTGEPEVRDASQATINGRFISLNIKCKKP